MGLEKRGREGGREGRKEKGAFAQEVGQEGE